MKTEAGNRVVISGLGVVSPLGTGLDLFTEALKGGETGIAALTGFESAEYPAHSAGRMEDFVVADYLASPKNYLDRNTELAFGALKPALDHAGLEPDKLNQAEVALCWGTAFGGTETMHRFFTDVQRKGPRFAKPILFPHTYANTAISLLSIEYGLSGPHLNFSAGCLAAGQAIVAGFDLIRNGRARIVLAGGAEAFSEMLFKYCLGHGLLSVGPNEQCRPFDAAANGTVAGEGAAALVLEDRRSALDRGAKIYAELRGTGLANSPGGWARPEAAAHLLRAMTQALAQAGLSSAQVDGVYAGANGWPASDRAEGNALNTLLAGSGTVVTGIAPMTGETFGASVGLQTVAATVTLRENFVPPLLNFRQAAGNWDFRFNTSFQEREIGKVLISRLDPAGGALALLIAKPET